MMKTFTCVICPKGCSIQVETDGKNVVSVQGNACKRGALYAENEVTNPVRTLTTTVTTDYGTLLPVKTTAPVPKAKLFEFMKIINQTTAKIPVEIGDVLIYNIGGSGADVVAAKTMK